MVDEFLSTEEIAELIRRSESLVYEVGKVADRVVEQVRNNERVLVDDPSLAAPTCSCASNPSCLA